MKISTFKAQSHIVPDLIDAVIAQFGGKADFKESASDVANHGIDGGFSGFIYYEDTMKFAKDNRELIMALAEDDSDQLGLSGALELIASFHCLHGLYSQTEIARAGYEDSSDETAVLQALAWYAAEEVCRSYDSLIEDLN
jgi:hypothetical protein